MGELKNIEDVAKFFGSTTKTLKRDVFNYTDCGAFISWDDTSVSLGSIVEGSDVEFIRTFEFPVDAYDMDAWINELEFLCEQEWNSIHFEYENE